jgi:hypothetical protein
VSIGSPNVIGPWIAELRRCVSQFPRLSTLTSSPNSECIDCAMKMPVAQEAMARERNIRVNAAP